MVKAFFQMALGPPRIPNHKGLRFIKIMGSGGKKGFSVWPSLQNYALLAIWDSEEDAKRFFDSAWWKNYLENSHHHFTAYLQAAQAHGLWGGQQPFPLNGKLEENSTIGVLTRATIKPRLAWRFWKDVPIVSQSLQGFEGVQLSIGIGEWPWIQQATFSLWDSQKAMMNYAYRSKHHREAIQNTRKLGWYSEELFARFVPLRTEGVWEG